MNTKRAIQGGYGRFRQAMAALKAGVTVGVTAALIALSLLALSSTVSAEARGLKPQAWAGEGAQRHVVSYTAVCQSGRLDRLHASSGRWCTALGDCYRNKIKAAHASCGLSTAAISADAEKYWLVSGAELEHGEKEQRAEM